MLHIFWQLLARAGKTFFSSPPHLSYPFRFSFVSSFLHSKQITDGFLLSTDKFGIGYVRAAVQEGMDSFKKNLRCLVCLAYCHKLGCIKKQKTHKPKNTEECLLSDKSKKPFLPHKRIKLP